MALKQNFTREYLKQHIGEQQIFNYYFGPFELNKSYNSVLRQDYKKSTGFYITEHNSIIYHDFANSKKYDFVQFVMELFGLNYFNALQRIAADFGLLNGLPVSSKAAIIQPLKTLIKPQKKQITLNIQVYKPHHLKYWEHYHITPAELKQNEIYAVKNYKINGNDIPTDNNIRFAYIIHDEENTYVKIYTPFAEEYKWVTNSPLNIMFGYTSLSFSSDTLFICKAQKERIITLKLFTDCVSLQSENIGSVNAEQIDFLKTKYKRIIYFGDCDQPGLTFADYMQSTYGIEAYTFPPQFLTKFKIKDIADFVALWGVDSLAKYFKQVHIL